MSAVHILAEDLSIWLQQCSLWLRESYTSEVLGILDFWTNFLHLLNLWAKNHSRKIKWIEHYCYVITPLPQKPLNNSEQNRTCILLIRPGFWARSDINHHCCRCCKHKNEKDGQYPIELLEHRTVLCLIFSLFSTRKKPPNYIALPPTYLLLLNSSFFTGPLRPPSQHCRCLQEWLFLSPKENREKTKQ